MRWAWPAVFPYYEKSLMNKLSPLLLLLACAPALADEARVAMLPDGSTDMYVGMAVGARLGSADLNGHGRGSVMPLLQVEWANGIFIANLTTLGLHLSTTPGLEYGPFLETRDSRHPNDRRGLAGTETIEGNPNLGAFVNYYLGADARLTSSLYYDSNAHGAGLHVGLQKSLPNILPHHTLTFSLGLSAANGRVMRQRYGVTADAERYPGLRGYRAPAGLSSVDGGVNWNWKLSPSWMINTAVNASRFGASVADSPTVNRSSVVSVSTGLAYRF